MLLDNLAKLQKERLEKKIKEEEEKKEKERQEEEDRKEQERRAEEEKKKTEDCRKEKEQQDVEDMVRKMHEEAAAIISGDPDNIAELTVVSCLYYLIISRFSSILNLMFYRCSLYKTLILLEYQFSTYYFNVFEGAQI